MSDKIIHTSHLKCTSHSYIHICTPHTTVGFGSLSGNRYRTFSAFYLMPAFQNTQQKSEGGYALLPPVLSLPVSGLTRHFQQTELEHTSLQFLSPWGETEVPSW